MIPLTLAHLAEATGASLFDAEGQPAGPDSAVGAVVVDGPVVTDSRECRAGSLYVARIGEHADGHAFVDAAVRAGAVAALTSHPVLGVPHLVVDDVQTAFGALARAVLDAATDLTVIGVTGSSGKTSTKDLLAQVLATAGETVAPVGSFNGEIGVPLTVCRVTPTTRFLVVEMGARGLGHISYLTRIAPPRIGVVLNVGTAHVGEFGSRDNIARAKAELVEALPPDGVAVLNLADHLVAAMAEQARGRVVFVSEAEHVIGAPRSPDLFATGTRLDPAGRASFDLVTGEGTAGVALRLHGAHHVGNALAVAAVALECGLTLDAVTTALSGATPTSRWRMEVTERADGVTVVNDAYNANPESMDAALRALAAMATDSAGRHRRTWAVLGEMLELGDDGRDHHLSVGASAVELGTDVVVAVGPGAEPIAVGARWGSGSLAVSDGRRLEPEVHTVADADAAYELLCEKLRPGDVVLVKSSNAAGLRWLGDRVAESVHGSEVGS
jgi:UDP-N-acetylmuramoyl-tripeptide--D-alanyl-D-alanine ligase